MLYFIINPHSGNGNGRATADNLETLLADVPHTMIFTQNKGDATALAAQCCQKEDCTGVVAVGGDGTVNEVVNGMDLRVPLGVIASGSGNDFLRTFAPGSTLEEQLQPIREGKRARSTFCTSMTCVRSMWRARGSTWISFCARQNSNAS